MSSDKHLEVSAASAVRFAEGAVAQGAAEATGDGLVSCRRWSGRARNETIYTTEAAGVAVTVAAAATAARVHGCAHHGGGRSRWAATGRSVVERLLLSVLHDAVDVAAQTVLTYA